MKKHQVQKREYDIDTYTCDKCYHDWDECTCEQCRVCHNFFPLYDLYNFNTLAVCEKCFNELTNKKNK